MRPRWFFLALAAISISACKGASQGESKDAEDPGKALEGIRLPEVPSMSDEGRSDLVVKLAGKWARVVHPNGSEIVDFGQRDPQNPHLRPALFEAADLRFSSKLKYLHEAGGRPTVRFHADAATPMGDLVDAFATLMPLHATGFEIDVSTPEGPRAFYLNLPTPCSPQMEPSNRRCTEVHLHATSKGVIASAHRIDSINRCELNPEWAGKTALVTGKVVSPDDGSCPGWTTFGPGDPSLSQLIDQVQTTGVICSVEVSAAPDLPLSKVTPLMAAIRTLPEPVSFRAEGRVTCDDPAIRLSEVKPAPETD